MAEREELSEQEVEELLKTADGIVDELNNEVKHVSVRVDSSSADVIVAIRNVFGNDFINADGSSFITHTMYDKVIDMLRESGRLKVEDYL